MQPIWAIALQASGIAEYHSSSMDNEDLYDEFGNFIGGSNDSGSESFSGSDLEPVDEEVSDEEAPHDVDVEQTQIVPWSLLMIFHRAFQGPKPS